MTQDKNYKTISRHTGINYKSSLLSDIHNKNSRKRPKL